MRSWLSSVSHVDAVDAAVVECQCQLAVAALVASRHVPCDVHAYAAAVWRMKTKQNNINIFFGELALFYRKKV